MTRTTIFIALVSLACAIAVPVRTAQAQNAPTAPTPEDLEKAKSAFATGSELFAANKFEEAVKAFKESYRLSRNPLLLYNIAVTLEALGDKKLALFYYKKFLSDSPTDVKNRVEAKASAEAIIAELEPAAPRVDPAEGTELPGTGTEPGGKTASGLEHNVITEAPPGHPLDITAFAPKAVGWKIFLFFRAPGAASFTQVEMKPRYNELVGRVPSQAMRGSTVQYYVEARDIGDEMVARSGKPTSPHVVLIEDGVKPRFYPDLEDDPVDIAPGHGGASDTGGPTNTMTYAKWGTTGAAIGFVTLSASFLLIARDASSGIEGSAFESNQGSCPARPCQPFGDSERSLQARGKRFELLSNVFFGLGVTTGAVAGVIWHLESKKTKSTNRSTSVTAVPAIGPDFVGGAASVRF